MKKLATLIAILASVVLVAGCVTTGSKDACCSKKCCTKQKIVCDGCQNKACCDKSKTKTKCPKCGKLVSQCACLKAK